MLNYSKNEKSFLIFMDYRKYYNKKMELIINKYDNNLLIPIIIIKNSNNFFQK